MTFVEDTADCEAPEITDAAPRAVSVFALVSVAPAAFCWIVLAPPPSEPNEAVFRPALRLCVAPEIAATPLVVEADWVLAPPSVATPTEFCVRLRPEAPPAADTLFNMATCCCARLLTAALPRVVWAAAALTVDGPPKAAPLVCNRLPLTRPPDVAELTDRPTCCAEAPEALIVALPLLVSAACPLARIEPT